MGGDGGPNNNKPQPQQATPALNQMDLLHFL